jgi:hypothetical protein
MSFFREWISGSLVTGAALAGAIVAMQAPALTREYAGALLQLAQDSRQDVEQRMASARQYYAIREGSDTEVIERLKAVEPSNAETLALSVERSRTFAEAYARIDARPALLQPIAAATDAILADPQGYKRNVFRTLLRTYAVQLTFTPGAALYGVAGLFLGSLVARVLLALPASLLRRRAHRRRAAAASTV